jgi:hypothetical protein
MKALFIGGLTFFFVLLLVLGAEAINLKGPGWVVAAVFGALGCMLAQSTYWLIAKYVLKSRSA